MSTQDHEADTVDPGKGAHAATEAVEPIDDVGETAGDQSDSRAGVTDSATESADSGTGGSLIAEGELSGLRLRWNDIQTGFVDDPRQSVQKADRLVSDVVDQLTAGFAAARSRLEEQWNQGEEASTEDLRVALKRYRQFFDHLLEV